MGEESMKQHIKRAHSIEVENDESEDCDQCNISFVNPDLLRNHIMYEHEVSLEELVVSESITLEEECTWEGETETVISNENLVLSVLTEILQNVVDDIGRNDGKDVTKTNEIDAPIVINDEDVVEISQTNDVLLDAPIDELEEVDLSSNVQSL